jgi:hypothetical protein
VKQKNQSGFLSIELLVIVSVLASVILLQTRQQASDTRRLAAMATGQQVSQYISALRAFISDQGGLILPSIETGVNWLKGPDCGGSADKNYLSDCAFPASPGFDLSYQAELRNDGSRFQADVVLGQAPANVAGIITLTANAGDISNNTPVSGTFYAVNNEIETGEITALVNNDPNIDSWIRRDGSNSMAADFNVGGQDIINVRDINAAGSIAAERFTDKNDNTFSLDPNGNSRLRNVNLAGDIFVESSGQFLSNLVTQLRGIVGNNSRVNKPVCNHGSPQIFTTPVVIMTGGAAELIAGYRAFATNIDSSTWQVQTEVLSEVGFTLPDGPFVQIKFETSCG